MSRARFQVNRVDMRAVGELIVSLNQARLTQALNVHDQPAAPLARGYAAQKERKGGRTVRDWYLSGLTRGSMAVLSVGANTVTVGFSDSVGAMRAAINNAREKQFGISPLDQTEINVQIQRGHPIEVKVERK